MRYLVTGATGFVGSHIVDRLCERGDAVRALVLESSEAEALRKRGVEVWLGDLSAAVDVSPAVDGVDVVIHCAGAAPPQWGVLPPKVWEVNLGGTERLLAASAQVGLSRFVYLSSAAVYGYAPPPVIEEAPKRPVGPYSESKWAAEQALWRYHAEYHVPAVALRPCMIYGQRDHKFSQGLLRRCRMRAVPLPRGGRCILDLVYVSDVVEAALAAATQPTAVGHSYNITDGEVHTYRDLLIAYGQLTGRRPAILPFPSRPVALALQVMISFMQVSHTSDNWVGPAAGPGLRIPAIHPFPGRAMMLALQMILHLMRVSRIPDSWMNLVVGLHILNLDTHFAIDAARRDLGYAPKAGLTEGLRRTLAWSLEQESGSGK